MKNKQNIAFDKSTLQYKHTKCCNTFETFQIKQNKKTQLFVSKT